MVVAAMWRGIDVLRPITLLYAVYSGYVRRGQMERPWLAIVVWGVLGGWTVTMFLWRRRDTLVVGIELALTCAAILSTLVVDLPDVIASGAKTVPGYFPAASVVGWAVLRGWRGGMFAALVVGAADLLEVVEPTENTINNMVILFLLGGCVGYCADLSRDGHTALEEALRVRAAVRERDRLARTIHDGVLQTLSYINRRGSDLGGEARELGTMAGEQERLLRALVGGAFAPDLGSVGGTEVDLRAVLGRHGSDAVQVIPPADAVRLPRPVAEELAAAVGAALDNVRRHAGPDARAWVLIEDDGADVVVTIRDDGVGLPASGIEQAAASGRLGVACSIKGRVGDLGGTTTYDSRPGSGTQVELRVPKRGRR